MSIRGSRGLAAVLLAIAVLACAGCGDDDGAATAPESPAWRTTELPGRPSAVLIDADGEVLVVDDELGQVLRIGVDPEPVVVEGTAPGAALVGLAEAGGGLWVVDARGVASRIGSPGIAVDLGGALVDVVGAGGALYVGDLEAGVVHELDAVTGGLRRAMPVPAGVVRLALEGERLWVTGTDRSVTPIDLATGVAGPPAEVGLGPIGVAVADGTVWVANGDDGTVSRLDAATGARRGPDVAVGPGPVAVDVHGDDVWVLAQDGGEVSHLHAGTGRLVDDTALPEGLGRARDLAVTQEGVYVVGVDGSMLAFLPTT